MDWMGLSGLLGGVAIAIALLVLGLLSKRLGSVTRTPPYYIGLYIAAGLMFMSTLARMVDLDYTSAEIEALSQDPAAIVLYVGLPALAVTIGVVVTWRYWSWLLAERN
ncbi:MAG: hypothetical protein H6672_14445 [Anaerolineaceae bacterium]|nr:hypothetical protein [Anaerolineaceae bacterium]